MSISKIAAILLIMSVAFSVFSPSYKAAVASSEAEPLNTEDLYARALEATDWIIGFQVSPPSSSLGMPYNSSKAWGLDPFFYINGTITGGLDGVKTGERQKLAYLIGGHDSGEGAAASLEAFIHTGDPKFMRSFDNYFKYFQRAQMPSAQVSTESLRSYRTEDGNITIDESGFFAEQANVGAGPDGIYGTVDDDVKLKAVFPSAEHGNPIAYALLLYYKLSSDETALRLLNNYGNWLIRSQIKDGNFSGAFPVTQFYYHIAKWKPRMFETAQSAWILSELYRTTSNKTYLEAAVRAGDYMLKRQYTQASWNDSRVDGALPYEGNRTSYVSSVSTNHAGYTLLAWTNLFRLTGNETYLYGVGGSPNRPTGGAVKYANWLLSFQVTPESVSWGNHTFAKDSFAMGGFYSSFNPHKHSFGRGVAQTVWSVSYGAKGLLLLYQVTKDERYLEATKLAVRWLSSMKFEDETSIPLQGLGGTKFVRSSWWGRYPQLYQPDPNQLKEIFNFTGKGTVGKSSILKGNLTWFERTFNVDFNLVNFQMASRGDRYTKMIWGSWPDVGFEPRYGGDLAVGFYTLAAYQEAKELTERAEASILQLKGLGLDSGSNPFPQVKAASLEAARLLDDAEKEFSNGWYSLSSKLAKEAINKVGEALAEMKRLTSEYLVATNSTLTSFSRYEWFDNSSRQFYLDAVSDQAEAEQVQEREAFLAAYNFSSTARNKLEQALEKDSIAQRSQLNAIKEQLTDLTRKLSEAEQSSKSKFEALENLSRLTSVLLAVAITASAIAFALTMFRRRKPV